jgi:hypothetical protein
MTETTDVIRDRDLTDYMVGMLTTLLSCKYLELV